MKPHFLDVTKPPGFIVRGRPIQNPGSSRESPMPRRGVCGLESANWVTKKPKPTRVQNLAETPASGRFQLGDGGPRGGEAPRGALRGGLGGQQGRQTEIDDHQRAALSCCGTGLPLCWGGPVRAALKQKEGKLRTGLCGPRGPVRPARLRGFRFAGTRPKTRGSFGQSESDSPLLSTAMDSELEALHGCT